MLNIAKLNELKAPQYEDRTDSQGNVLRVRKLPVRLLRQHFVGVSKVKDPQKQAERQDALLAACIVQEDGVTPVGTAEDYRDIPIAVALEWTRIVLEVNRLTEDVQNAEDAEGND
jgi:hypothetical protein